MNPLIIFIFIICAFGLHSVKRVGEAYRNHTLKGALEKAVRKALYVTLVGIGVVGLACVALCLFPLVRIVGFSVLPGATVDFIRSLMDVVFDTKSVFVAIKLLASVVLIATEFSLIFTLLGFLLVKTLSLPCFMEWLHCEGDVSKCARMEFKAFFAPRKLFLSFANLKI